MTRFPFRFPPLLPWHNIVESPVLVIAPHADDEVISAGGLLSLAAASGMAIRVLHLSDGSAGDPERRFGDIVAHRRQESDAALAVLGLAPAIELGFPDGTLAAAVDVIAERIAQHIEELQPRTIVALSPLEAHADHRVAAEALRMALIGQRTHPQILWAGVNSPVPANVLIDISDVTERKDAAIACYTSQIAYNDVRSKVRALDKARTVNVDLPSVTACEAFLRLAAAETEALFALVSGLERIAFGEISS
jgi:LmbE family N-acetylglucosaminyl deacetylase